MANVYELVKDEIKAKSVSQEQLEDLKDYFHDDIGSIRLKSCMQSVSDLLDALERRDIINENKTEALELMTKIIDNDKDHITEKLEKNEPKNDNLINEYTLERIREELEDQTRIAQNRSQNAVRMPIPMQQQNINPMNANCCTGINKVAIHKLIAMEIGRKWRDFGREIGIREGEMDTLEMDYPKDFRTRIFKMLELFEEPGREDPKRYIIKICNALETCRRKDLSRKINEILVR